MARSSIRNAPYNPRQIDSYARKKLERNLKKVGLIEPVIVNKRTSNLVGGHQRLAALDALEGSGDYLLDVAMCSLSDAEERAQNVFLNNPSAQGTWDLDALAKLLKTTPGMGLDDTGFELMDLQVMFDDSELSSMFAADNQPEAVKASLDALGDITGRPLLTPPKRRKRDRAVDTPDKVGAMIDERANMGERYTAEEDTEIFAVVVFRTRDEREAFMTSVGGEPDDRYVDGARVLHRLRPDTH